MTHTSTPPSQNLRFNFHADTENPVLALLRFVQNVQDQCNCSYAEALIHTRAIIINAGYESHDIANMYQTRQILDALQNAGQIQGVPHEEISNFPLPCAA